MEMTIAGAAGEEESCAGAASEALRRLHGPLAVFPLASPASVTDDAASPPITDAESTKTDETGTPM